MQKGDKIVCCNISPYKIGESGISTHIKPRLTIGKSYIIETADSQAYCVRNDKGNLNWYKKDRFVSLKEYRKQKINKIYESSVC